MGKEEKEKQEKAKTCFIIMPITVPEPFVKEYRDGVLHFRHVLDCLFMPAVRAAGYEPIPPKAKGADLIHAEIVRSLETSDLVLCDMSCLNPNVFFEFGIRTSLNKPVCVVKDELTAKVPFDTSILNYHEYKSTLEPWELEGETKKLADHVGMSADRSKGENSLWRYFGLRTSARSYEGETGTDAKLEYLAMQIDSLRRRMPTTEATNALQGASGDNSDYRGEILERLGELIPRGEAGRFRVTWRHPGRVLVEYRGRLSAETKWRIQQVMGNEWDVKIDWHQVSVEAESGEGKTITP